MSTYNRLPLAFTRGEGVWLEDSEGKKYLDAISGIAVCGLGHCHPDISKAICDQASTLVHTSNLYEIPLQTRLADRLAKLTGMDKVFFANSGAEANEAAIKIARLYGHKKGIDTPSILVCEGSFHGRTMATLSATGNRKVRAGFEPLLRGFSRVPFNDLESVHHAATNDKNVVAILVEPIQGEGGIKIPDEGYLAALREICDDNGWLLMLDEIQTGLCRSGKWFAHQHAGVVPDVMTLAKALGNGMPVGACVVNNAASQVFGPGNHGSTFGGNPLASATALSVLDVLERDNLADQASQSGALLKKLLADALAGKPGVKEVRGVGLLLAIELTNPCGELVMKAADKGLLINVTADNVIRLLPPLVANESEIREIATRLIPLVEEFLNT
ncbi:MAG: aspartate aminotransferase family protein [Gammaproteobacteria bacterium]|nr:aspartate aminotransferase family protein [Gammaproteobacteria bacterium]MDX2487825.1 aspartate aminotransferase family protein [Gammaproteobacteria bacterium]